MFSPTKLQFLLKSEDIELNDLYLLLLHVPLVGAHTLKHIKGKGSI